MKKKLFVTALCLMGIITFSNAEIDSKNNVSVDESSERKLKTDYRDGYAWILYADGCYRLNYVIFENDVLVYNEPINPMSWASGSPTTVCTYSSVINQMC